MRADTLKLIFVYGNITFVIVATIYCLFQLATREGLSPEAQSAVGFAAIFGSALGTAIQFLTGSEIARRADLSASAAFATGLAAPTPPPTTTTTTTEGPPKSETTTTVGAPPAPATPAPA